MLLPTEYITRLIQRAAIHRIHKTQEQTGNSLFSSHNGFSIAHQILSYKRMNHIDVKCTKQFNDSYNHIQKTVYLSPSVYHESTVRSVSIAAHEAGHATQTKWLERLFWIRLPLEFLSDTVVIASLFMIPTLFWQEVSEWTLSGVFTLCLILSFFLLAESGRKAANRFGNESWAFSCRVMEIGMLFVPLIHYVLILHWEWILFLWLMHFASETLLCLLFVLIEADASLRAYYYLIKLRLIRNSYDKRHVRQVLSLAFMTYVSELVIASVCFWLLY